MCIYPELIFYISVISYTCFSGKSRSHLRESVYKWDATHCWLPPTKFWLLTFFKVCISLQIKPSSIIFKAKISNWSCLSFINNQNSGVCAGGLTWPAASLHQHRAPAVPWAPLTRPYRAPRRWSLGQSDRWLCGGWCCGEAAWGWGAAAAGRSAPYLQTVETVESD